MKKFFIFVLLAIIFAIITFIIVYKYVYMPDTSHCEKAKEGKYWVVQYPTQNISAGRNKVDGVVLHHTATWSLRSVLNSLCSPEKNTSCHVVIDKDGTRYILAKPTAITWHAGYSYFKGREHCNNFMIGIEFHGDTTKSPLTDDQIESAIDYLLPIMKKYGLTANDFVTHATIRNNWIKQHQRLAKENEIMGKVDITDAEFQRFIQRLRLH